MKKEVPTSMVGMKRIDGNRGMEHQAYGNTRVESCKVLKISGRSDAGMHAPGKRWMRNVLDIATNTDIME